MASLTVHAGPRLAVLHRGLCLGRRGGPGISACGADVLPDLRTQREWFNVCTGVNCSIKWNKSPLGGRF